MCLCLDGPFVYFIIQFFFLLRWRTQFKWSRFKVNFTHMCFSILLWTPRTVWKWCKISTYDHHPVHKTNHMPPQSHMNEFLCAIFQTKLLLLFFLLTEIIEILNELDVAMTTACYVCTCIHTHRHSVRPQTVQTNESTPLVQFIFQPKLYCNYFSTPALAVCICVWDGEQLTVWILWLWDTHKI